MKDIKNYRTGSHSISNGQVLPRAYSYDEAQLAIKEQAELLSLQMVKEKVTADSMTMYVGYEVCSPGYTGQYRIDCYGRKVPSYSGGTIRFGTFTNYSKQIIPAAVSLYQRIARPELKVRRIFLTVNNVRSEQDTWFQLDLFSDCSGMERQKRLEKAVLTIKSKYGPNAILRGISLCDGARTKERNTQIGGHKAYLFERLPELFRTSGGKPSSESYDNLMPWTDDYRSYEKKAIASLSENLKKWKTAS